MEVGMLPSQFLNVVLEESDRNGSLTADGILVPRSLSTSITISPVVPKSTVLQEKKINGKYSYSRFAPKAGPSKLIDGSSYEKDYLDLKKRLPRTVLEECIVELASPKKSFYKVPENTGDAIIIEPMYTKKTGKKSINRRKTNMEFPDIFNQVEVVYSDDDELPTAKKLNSIPALEPLFESINTLPYACDHCPNKYSNKGALWQHNVAAHSIEKSCECQLCGRKFYRNCSLALHMKCHSDEQNCSCKVCGKEFNRLSMLERHAKCHNAELPTVTATVFGCKICGKKFNDDMTLKMHFSTHTEKYTCEQCNVTFSTKQLLDLHFHITHKRSETPFACKMCKARFANLRELNEHSVSHTFEKSRISCHHCGEVFTQRCTYKKHLQLHVGERLSCTICRIDFTQRSSLLRHYKRLHLLNDIPSTSAMLEMPSLTITTK